MVVREIPRPGKRRAARSGPEIMEISLFHADLRTGHEPRRLSSRL